MQTETIEINLEKDGNYTIEKTPLSQIAVNKQAKLKLK